MSVSRKNPSGFTLLELLVLIALIAVLAAIMAPAFSFGREAVNRAQCASNLRQLGIAVHIDAQENGKQLPVRSGGAWPWDIDASVLHRLLATGAVSQETLYCPSGWLQASDLSLAFEDLPPNSFVLTTYVLLSNDAPGVPQQYTIQELGDLTVAGRGSTATVIPEEWRELAVDVVMSTGTSADADFMGITGGAQIPYRTNHMNGDRPAGGNIVFLDGSVEWREFSEMRVRTTAGPSWWW